VESSLGSWDPSEASSFSDALHCVFAEGPGPVLLQAAPIKRVERMRDKILKYSADDGPSAAPAAGWPAAARILDPVRASIVCEGASRMLQVAQPAAPSNWLAAAPACQRRSDERRWQI
jgi:hypothetical protein